ncbi:MAG: hypothetical protein U0821_13405 [Chloroflexota bacterium]
MVFFFELALFALMMVTIAIGEFGSRLAALTVWSAATVLSFAAYVVTGRRPSPATALDARWRDSLRYAWRRTNGVLAVGVLATAVWWWLKG